MMHHQDRGLIFPSFNALFAQSRLFRIRNHPPHLHAPIICTTRQHPLSAPIFPLQPAHTVHIRHTMRLPDSGDRRNADFRLFARRVGLCTVRADGSSDLPDDDLAVRAGAG